MFSDAAVLECTEKPCVPGGNEVSDLGSENVGKACRLIERGRSARREYEEKKAAANKASEEEVESEDESSDDESDVELTVGEKRTFKQAIERKADRLTEESSWMCVKEEVKRHGLQMLDYRNQLQMIAWDLNQVMVEFNEKTRDFAQSIRKTIESIEEDFEDTFHTAIEEVAVFKISGEK